MPHHRALDPDSDSAATTLDDALLAFVVENRRAFENLAPFSVASFDCELPLPDERERLLDELGPPALPVEPAASSRSPRRSTTIPPAPVLDDLPRITRGPHKGEHEMSKPEFAGWCRVTVATVSDWIHTGRIDVRKLGTSKQARVRIAHGERGRLKPPLAHRGRRSA